ncbi:MAG TPA: pyruvoyl-dependent arginine decarboxylase [Calditrichia bacterium]|nr:pyruvoyl-dependent arginine decarboxylase [Calditrichota bacterium]HQU73371.1 pyruvoyl-dependent arginine decarboxylase [Calditrichia bacterium]HQV30603.1 pyruvoyl-dependent arginine decarboxylase [Calditrichia bacterium]
MNNLLISNGSAASPFGMGAGVTVNQILIGNRIPKDYFVTRGRGESDIAIHAGSYHLALKDAGIEMANIMTYSSIMPAIATEVPYPPHITHGAVLESIMAVGTCQKGERVSSGIIWGWLTDRITGEKYGGLVCEECGDYSQAELSTQLRASLDELYTNGFDDRFELGNIRVETETMVPEKKYGTAIVAICFTNYMVPVLQQA